MKYGLFIFSMLICLGMGACEPEKPKPTLQQLAGNWMVQAAKRNERPTKLLEGTFFAFTPEGGVRSNLPLYETEGAWTSSLSFTNDSTLTFGQPPMEYTIKTWSDSTLELEFTTRGLPFLLYLHRVADLVDRDSITIQ